MKRMRIVLGLKGMMFFLLVAYGCATRETARVNNLGEEGKSAKTTYFLGIPVLEQDAELESRVPD